MVWIVTLAAAGGLVAGILLILLLGRRWLLRPVLDASRQAQAGGSRAERDGQQDVLTDLRQRLDRLTHAVTSHAPSTDLHASIDTLTQQWRSLSRQLDAVAGVAARAEESRRERLDHERASAEQVRRETADRQRALIDACPVPMAVCRVPDGMVITANVEFARLLGRAVELLPGRPLMDLFTDSADRDRVARALAQHTPVQDLELRCRRWDGESRLITAALRPVTLDGHPSALVALTDIGERHRVEAELRRGLSLLTATLESTADGIMVVDRTGKVVTYNQKLLEMWRIPESTIRGATEQDLMMSLMDQLKDPEAFLRTARKTAQDPESDTSDVLEFRDGRMFERYSVPQRIGPEVVGRVWSFRDLTERSWVEQALQESEEQLLQSQKMDAIGRLAGGVAHDLNNLLTVITGYTRFLLDALEPQTPAHRDADEIRDATKRAEALIQQLLAFSRKQPHQPRKVDLNELVAGLSRMLQRLLGEDIRLVTALSTAPSVVLVDQNQISQVVINLVVNARDAMPKGGMVTIETANVEVTAATRKAHAGLRAGSYALLTVCDTGVGMDPNTVAHCMEPFFTTKPAGRGTGLGLSTVYGIVKQSDGVIDIQSELGRGTAVRIHFPRLQADAPVELAASAVRPVPSGTETILLVEDEEKVRLLLRKVIEQQGYTVIEAESGDAALRIMAAHPAVDLLVTDVVMPGMGGRELASRLVAERPSLKILFISGYAGGSSAQRDSAEPILPLLQKPFGPAELGIKIREVLDEGQLLSN